MGSDSLTPKQRNEYEYKPKRCGVCEELFTPTSSCHKYCSDECLEHARDEWYLLRTYKITKKKYDEMLEEQNYKCKICGSEGFLMRDRHKKKLVVDHCHTTGRVRGLLCHNCNRGIGLLKENKNIFIQAMKYLDF